MSQTSTFPVEVARRDPTADPAALHLLEAARADGHDLAGLRLAEVYGVGPVTREQASTLAAQLFADPAFDRPRVAAGDDPRGGGALLEAAELGRAVTTVSRTPGPSRS